MTAIQTEPKAAAAGLDATDLAGLMESFNLVTARLEQTHIKLREEVVRLQSELHAANLELERSSRLAALGEMAAGIAHEVRNPLGSIGLYARMLVDDLADRQEQRALAERIGGAVRGLDAIVNDVLVFGRELRTHPDSVRALDVVEGAIARCGDLLSGEYAPDVDSDRCDPKVELEADQPLLVQALTNVLRNAIEASSEQHPHGGGSVALNVRTSAEVAGPGASGPMVVFGVDDTGPGVSDEVLERMFNPFFTTRAAGTGLGLPIVHRIVEAHGGRVVVSRRSAGGTRFELQVPISSVRGARSPEASGIGCEHEASAL